MSVTKETTIWCDSCGVWEQSTDNAPEIRKVLKKEGWERHKGKDYCPKCVTNDYAPQEEEELPGENPMFR